MLKCTILAFAFVIAAANLIHGQAAIPHVHTQSAVIDGAAHPELISDLAAFRLYLLTVARSANPTDAEQKQQAAQLRRVGLSDADLQTTLPILTTFLEQYQTLVRNFNEDASDAHGQKESSLIPPRSGFSEIKSSDQLTTLSPLD